MKKLTRKEWKALETKEEEKEEKLDEECERLAYTRPVKERLTNIRSLFD